MPVIFKPPPACGGTEGGSVFDRKAYQQLQTSTIGYMMNFSYIAPLGLGYLVYRLFYKHVAPLGLNEVLNQCFSRFTHHVINSYKLAHHWLGGYNVCHYRLRH